MVPVVKGHTPANKRKVWQKSRSVCSASGGSLVDASLRLLTINEKPIVAISLKSPDRALLENTSALLSCDVKKETEFRVESGHRSSSSLTYKWYKDGSPVEGVDQTEDGRILHLQTLTRVIHHNAMYSCIVGNDVGHSEEPFHLQMKYPPRFLSREKMRWCPLETR